MALATAKGVHNASVVETLSNPSFWDAIWAVRFALSAENLARVSWTGFSVFTPSAVTST